VFLHAEAPQLRGKGEPDFIPPAFFRTSSKRFGKAWFELVRRASEFGAALSERLVHPHERVGENRIRIDSGKTPERVPRVIHQCKAAVDGFTPASGHPMDAKRGLDAVAVSVL
jgi:hypothetical protein